MILVTQIIQTTIFRARVNASPTTTYNPSPKQTPPIIPPLWRLRRFPTIRFLSLRHPGRFSNQYFRRQLPQFSQLPTQPPARRLQSKLHKPRLHRTATTRVTIQTSYRLPQSRYCPVRRLYLRRNLGHGIRRYPTSRSRMLRFPIQLTSGSTISIRSRQKMSLRR